jgi:hypothetical protein
MPPKHPKIFLIKKLFFVRLMIWSKLSLSKKLANSMILANDLCQPSVPPPPLYSGGRKKQVKGRNILISPGAHPHLATALERMLINM